MSLKKCKYVCFFAFVCMLSLIFIEPVVSVSAFENLTPNSKSSILVEYGTGEILAENNSTEKMPIASVTKLMTILLTLESIKNGKLDLEQSVIASENSAGMGGSQVFIDANAEYEVKNLLKAVIVASANDASVCLAETIAGSEENFVQLMNKKAGELGLENTNYQNCTGLPAPSQYSCAKDVATIMKELVKYPLYFEISGIWMEDFEHPSGRVTGMANTNKLIKFYNGCDAGKTGSTNEAGFCLASTAKRADMRLISVVLGAKTSKERFADASNLLNWGFNNYQSVKVVDKTTNLAENINLQKAKENNLVLNAEEDFYAISKKGESSQFEVNMEIPEKLNAPLKAGDVVGKLLITKNGEVKKEIAVVVCQDVQALGFFGTFKNILSKWNL